MQKEFVVTDSFMDYAGKEHQFIIVAVQKGLRTARNCPAEITQCYEDGWESIGTVQMGLKVGVAVCNPTDEYNYETGKIKALARATNSPFVMCTAHAGQMSEDLIYAYLMQEVHYVKSHPECYIKGYNTAKASYNKRIEREQMWENMTEMEKVIVDHLQKDSTYLDNVLKYVKCVKH